MDVKYNHERVLDSWNSGSRRPIVTKYYTDKDALFDNYAYPGGGSVLHMLRKQLGDRLFFASLHKYLTDNAHQPVSTEELRIAVEETSGQSMDWFFDEWLYRMGHPIFEITQNYDDAKKQLTLNVKQTQKVDLTNAYPQTAFFQSWVDVEIDNKVERVWLKPQAENVFTFDSPTKPKLVNFDYESTLLKEMKFDKSVDDLLYQMKNDKDPLGRRWAMDEVMAKAQGADKDRIVAALLDSSEKDPFWRIRRAALSVLAMIYSPDPVPGQPRPAVKLDPAAEAVVLRLAKDKNDHIRGEAIELLGETQDRKYADIMLGGLNDQSYEIIDQSAEAIARVKDPRAFDALVKLTNTPSWKGRIETAGLTGLSLLGDKRAFDAGLRIATDVNAEPNVRSRAASIVAAYGKGDPRAFPIVFDIFKRALDANDLIGIQNTIGAIIEIADPRGQQAFDLLKAKFKDNPQAMQQIALAEAAFKAAISK
jgi:aminopeptidase N